MVLIGAVLAAVLLVFAVIVPLDRTVAQTRKRITQKTTDLAWMHQVTPELAAAAPIVRQSNNGQSLLVIIDRSAHEANLAESLVGTEPSGNGAGLRVRLEKAPFDVLVLWMSRLQEQSGVKIDSASIDSAGKPGLVNAAIALHQAQ